MGVMVDYREISVADLKALRVKMKNALLDMVSKKSNRPRGELIVRDILPNTDLNLTSEEWTNKTALTGGTWTADFNHELDDDQGVIFYGVHIHDDSFNFTFMRFKLGATGATVKDLVSLQAIFNGDAEHNKGYFSPVTYEPGAHIYIDYYVRASVGAGASHIELIGLFCEPRGEQIS